MSPEEFDAMTPQADEDVEEYKNGSPVSTSPARPHRAAPTWLTMAIIIALSALVLSIVNTYGQQRQASQRAQVVDLGNAAKQLDLDVLASFGIEPEGASRVPPSVQKQLANSFANFQAQIDKVTQVDCATVIPGAASSRPVTTTTLAPTTTLPVGP